MSKIGRLDALIWDMPGGKLMIHSPVALLFFPLEFY